MCTLTPLLLVTVSVSWNKNQSSMNISRVFRVFKIFISAKAFSLLWVNKEDRKIEKNCNPHSSLQCSRVENEREEEESNFFLFSFLTNSFEESFSTSVL